MGPAGTAAVAVEERRETSAGRNSTAARCSALLGVRQRQCCGGGRTRERTTAATRFSLSARVQWLGVRRAAANQRVSLTAAAGRTGGRMLRASMSRRSENARPGCGRSGGRTRNNEVEMSTGTCQVPEQSIVLSDVRTAPVAPPFFSARRAGAFREGKGEERRRSRGGYCCCCCSDRSMLEDAERRRFVRAPIDENRS